MRFYLVRGLFFCLIWMSAAFSPQATMAGSNCAPHSEVRQVLSDRFGETRRRVGTNSAGQIIEIFASQHTDSWTLVISFPDGMSCLAASGQNYSDDLDVPQNFASVRN